MDRVTRRGVWTVLVALGIAGCAAEPEPEDPAWVTRVTASTSGDPIPVDLRDEEHAWRFDPSEGALPFDRVLVIRPNGEFIRLNRWLVEQHSAGGLDLARRVDAHMTMSGNANLAWEALGLEPRVVEGVCQHSVDDAYLCADANLEPRPEAPDAGPVDDDGWTSAGGHGGGSPGGHDDDGPGWGFGGAGDNDDQPPMPPAP